MTDGAHLGVDAESSVRAVLGGDQPEEDQKRTPAQMRVYLEAASIDDCSSYEGTARYCAKRVLAYFSVHPEHATLPADRGTVIEERQRVPGDNGIEIIGRGWMYPVDGPDLYELVKANSSQEDYDRCFTELTGFMWGWAVNAARYCLDLPPTANPAIVEIGP